MSSKTQESHIIIQKTRFFDVPKVLTVYNESPNVKEKMMGAFPLSRKIGIFHLYLSTTLFYYFLPVQIESLVALLDNQVIGFVYLMKQRSKEEKIMGIFVSDHYQNRGIGKKLLIHILKGQTNVSLQVLSDNENAIGLYRKSGFETESIVLHMKLKK